jgi:hypothetical protein
METTTLVGNGLDFRRRTDKGVYCYLTGPVNG